MKCIDELGTIKRVTDATAEAAVKSGRARYVPRRVWKEEVRDARNQHYAEEDMRP